MYVSKVKVKSNRNGEIVNNCKCLSYMYVIRGFIVYAIPIIVGAHTIFLYL